MSGRWILVGDAQVKIESDAQLEATCRLFNLTVFEQDPDEFGIVELSEEEVAIRFGHLTEREMKRLIYC